MKKFMKNENTFSESAYITRRRKWGGKLVDKEKRMWYNGRRIRLIQTEGSTRRKARK